MPINLIYERDNEVADSDIEAALSRPIVSSLLEAFLNDVDFSPVFDDPNLAEHIERSNAHARLERGVWVECDEDDDGAEPVVIESLDGEVVAECLDMDDLSASFDYFVTEELADELLEDRTIKQVGLELLEMAKGTMSTMSKAGGAKRAKVNRMLGAMLVKNAITRAKGKPVAPTDKENPFDSTSGGYKPGSGEGKSGDYQKFKPGWPVGTEKGLGRWKKYKKKNAAALAKKSKQTMGDTEDDTKAKKGASKKVEVKKKATGKKAEKTAKTTGKPPVGKKTPKGAKTPTKKLGKSVPEFDGEENTKPTVTAPMLTEDIVIDDGNDHVNLALTESVVARVTGQQAK